MSSKKRVPPTEAELANPRTQEQFRLALRRKTRMFYDIQAMRLQMQGRLTKKAPGATIELHPMDKATLEKRLVELEVVEKGTLEDLDAHLQEVPFYKKVILPQRKEKYRGLGPRMASIIVSSFDIHREETVSQMWAFAGLSVVPLLRCKFCSAILQTTDKKPIETDYKYENLVDTALFHHPKPAGNTCKLAGCSIGRVQTINSGRAQRPVAGQKLNYNAWLRTKLCGVLAPVLLKVGSPYRKFYDNRKQYNIGRGWGQSDAHRHQDAMRYMIKMLLLDIYKEWREFEGLPVRAPYSEERLGHVTSIKPIETQFSTDEEIAEIDEVLRELDEPLLNDSPEQEYDASQF